MCLVLTHTPQNQGLLKPVKRSGPFRPPAHRSACMVLPIHRIPVRRVPLPRVPFPRPAAVPPPIPVVGHERLRGSTGLGRGVQRRARSDQNALTNGAADGALGVHGVGGGGGKWIWSELRRPMVSPCQYLLACSEHVWHHSRIATRIKMKTT